MMYSIELSKTALKDIEKHKKTGDVVLLRKIGKLLKELTKHPLEGTGQPELLKGNLQGLYSRRINRKHRLVYRVNDSKTVVEVLSAHSHYGDR